jgi:hypothetical protein
LSYGRKADIEEIMTANQLQTPANQIAANVPVPPSVADEATIVQFVRALAIRQARIDASQAFRAANDNERRTVH